MTPGRTRGLAAPHRLRLPPDLASSQSRRLLGRQAVPTAVDACLPLGGTGGLDLALLAPLPFFDRRLFQIVGEPRFECLVRVLASVVLHEQAPGCAVGTAGMNHSGMPVEAAT